MKYFGCQLSIIVFSCQNARTKGDNQLNFSFNEVLEDVMKHSKSQPIRGIIFCGTRLDTVPEAEIPVVEEIAREKVMSSEVTEKLGKMPWKLVLTSAKEMTGIQTLTDTIIDFFVEPSTTKPTKSHCVVS